MWKDLAPIVFQGLMAIFLKKNDLSCQGLMHNIIKCVGGEDIIVSIVTRLQVG
jgi:hypothetical protein